MFKVRKGVTVIEIAIVVAIVAILAGVWYVSKNKTGADIAMPGIGNNGTTSTGGTTIPPKLNMYFLSGIVIGIDGKPTTNATVFFRPSKCKDLKGDGGGMLYTDRVHSDGKYFIKPIPPGFYCGNAIGGNGWSFDTDAEVRSDGIETKVNFKLKPFGPPK